MDRGAEQIVLFWSECMRKIDYNVGVFGDFKGMYTKFHTDLGNLQTKS
ncbi:hypothetical protein J53TS2_25290 [Paenibacillus sp. J53TS2]|nr:hypothetical protein J53TS2_25290 [Paenibacillus sp. J53TS2]